MLPTFLNRFENSDIENMIHGGIIYPNTGSTGTIQLNSGFIDITSSLLSLPIDELTYSDSQIKNLQNYQITFFNTSSVTGSLQSLSQEAV